MVILLEGNTKEFPMSLALYFYKTHVDRPVSRQGLSADCFTCIEGFNFKIGEFGLSKWIEWPRTLHLR